LICVGTNENILTIKGKGFRRVTHIRRIPRKNQRIHGEKKKDPTIQVSCFVRRGHERRSAGHISKGKISLRKLGAMRKGQEEPKSGFGGEKNRGKKINFIGEKVIKKEGGARYYGGEEENNTPHKEISPM